MRSRTSLSAIRSLRVLIALQYNSFPIITPRRDGEALRDASLTSPALSPKIARRSFSSGVGSVSPLGVILPIRISPGTT